MSRRDRVDDRSAAERRLAAQDHAVAASGDDGRCETELGELLAESNDARGRVRRPDVHLHARAVLDRRDLLERDVEPVGGRIPAAGDERLPSRDLAALDAGKAHRDALARTRRARRRGRAPGRSARARRARDGSSRSWSPAPIEPDQSVPVTTVPNPGTENERST